MPGWRDNMPSFSGLVKVLSSLVSGTPANDDCFIFGKTDLKKVTLSGLKNALGIDQINSDLIVVSEQYNFTIPKSTLSSTGWKNVNANKIEIPSGYEVVGILPRTYTYKMSAIQGVFYDANNISFNFYLTETISEDFTLAWRAIFKKL